MLPKWFNDWNSKNRTDIYGPAILIGVVGGAVILAALIVTLGRPLPVDATQTGPRGTGMSVTKFVADRSAPDPTAAGYTTAPPIAPAAGAPRAGTAIPGAEPLLADLTPENYTRLVEAMRAWTGIPTLFDGEETYQTVVARQMIQMVQSLNENWAGHVNVSGAGGVNCYTCHRGQPVPSDIWFRVGPAVAVKEGWGGVQNRATLASQYTSLPSDALERYLLETNTIAVHDLDPRVEQDVTDPATATWQNTERTYALMNYFANSLNVNCVFCHNSRAFYDVAQNTPQWATAQLGIAMVQEINTAHLEPLQSVLPPERLGPVFGDAPKAACATCHKGYSRPLGGMDMLADWPELATTGAPVYQ
jgi:photosynthetic reaction center cytochrome c subunit